jgi:MFS family permease
MGGGRMRGATAVREADARPAGFSVKTFASLKIPAYRWYFLSQLSQMAAMNMQMVARTWFMYELTGRASLLGAVALANAFPTLTLSLFGGVLADRASKKTLLIFGQLGSLAVALGIAVSITLGSITWVHLIVASVLQGVVMAFMMPARQAVVPELVGTKVLMNAVALNSAAMNLLRLLAPAMAGYLIYLWGIEGVYYLMSGMYFVGLLFIFRLPHLSAVQVGRQRALAQVKDGLVYIRHNANLLALLVFTLLATVLSMPYMFLLPAFTKDILIVDVTSFGALLDVPGLGGLLAGLGESSARQGLLISISGIGALVGSLVVASMPNKNRGLWFLISVFVMAAAIVLFTMTDSFWLAALAFVPIGLGQAGRMALSNTLIQTYTEDAYRGRVMSVYMMEFGMTNLGVFVVGVLGEFIPIQAAVGGAAALLVAATVYYFFFTSRIRNLD